jgi:hypothetical protein
MAATAHTPISAEARGQMRLLKTQLTKQNARIGEMVRSGALRQFAEKLVRRNSVLGRSRVLKKLRNELGPGAHFEGASLDGPQPTRPNSRIHGAESTKIEENGDSRSIIVTLKDGTKRRLMDAVEASVAMWEAMLSQPRNL